MGKLHVPNIEQLLEQKPKVLFNRSFFLICLQKSKVARYKYMANGLIKKPQLASSLAFLTKAISLILNLVF